MTRPAGLELDGTRPVRDVGDRRDASRVDAGRMTTDPYSFEKGWRVALGYVRREGLAFFARQEGELAACLEAERAEASPPPADASSGDGRPAL